MKKFFYFTTGSLLWMPSFVVRYIKHVAVFFPLLASSGMVKAQPAWEPHIPGFSDTIYISDVHVVNENVIWAVGLKYQVNEGSYDIPPGNPYYAKTTDGGATWMTGVVPLAPDGQVCYVGNMTAIDSATAYIVGLENPFASSGHYGKTLKTTDGGASWTPSGVGWDALLSWPNFIYAFSPDRICTLGDPQEGEFEIYNSQDGGANWARVDGAVIPDPKPGEYGFNNAGDAYGSNIWFSTNSGRLFHSDDEGYTWEAFDTPVSTWGIERLAFSDAVNGIITEGNYGVFPYTSKVFHTSDGGNNWTDITPSGDPSYLFGCEYIPNSPYIIIGVSKGGWVSGPFETWMSPDRGNTWQQISTGERIVHPTFLDTFTGWAGEYQQAVHPTQLFRYTGNPMNGLWPQAAIDAKISLSPNPTLGAVYLEVETPHVNNFLMLLNDSQGNLIKSEQINNVADFQLQLDLSPYPAGVYTVTVSSPKGHVSHQFVKQ